MDASKAHKRLREIFKEFGISSEFLDFGGRKGIPYPFATQDSGEVIVHLPLPGPFGYLDSGQVGIAILDPLGNVCSTWGIAERIDYFAPGKSILQTPIGAILEGCLRGQQVALYFDGYRYFAATLPRRQAIEDIPSDSVETSSDATTAIGSDGLLPGDILVLVVNASDEKAAYRQSNRNDRIAKSLKRLGKALAVEAGAQKLCSSASHEMASAAELAAVLIWVPIKDSPNMKLAASVGVNRHGTTLLGELNAEDGSGCLAELAASTRKPFFCSDIATHILSSELESSICYLTPKGVSVYPLIASGRLVGVIEFIGNRDDEEFEENTELFETFAEQLMLALNAAQLYEEAERRASHDALTGLANHRTMQEFLHSRISEAERTGMSVGVIMIDVDHFRSFNEEEGHDAGDSVLKLVAHAIKQSVRPYDLAARYGGEEFTVIMPMASQDTLLAFAERIRIEIEQQGFETSTGGYRCVSASLGCGLYPQTCLDPIGVLKAADAALYSAKRNGRNQVQFFEGAFEESGPTHMSEIEVDQWLLPELANDVKRLESTIEMERVFLCERLGLSQVQKQAIEALIRFTPTYREVKNRRDLDLLQKMDSASDLRLLMPTLHSLDERYDGRGPKAIPGSRLPLLLRVLHVLLAVGEQDSIPLITDPGRFDPEIVGILADLPSAA